jgi:hypothetical protein
MGNLKENDHSEEPDHKCEESEMEIRKTACWVTLGWENGQFVNRI